MAQNVCAWEDRPWDITGFYLECFAITTQIRRYLLFSLRIQNRFPLTRVLIIIGGI